MSSGEDARALNGIYQAFMTCAFSPDGHTLAALPDSAWVMLWDWSNKDTAEIIELRYELPRDLGGPNHIWKASCSPDISTVLAIYDGVIVNVFRLATGELLWKLDSRPERMWSACFSRDGGQVAIGSSSTPERGAGVGVFGVQRLF